MGFQLRMKIASAFLCVIAGCFAHRIRDEERLIARAAELLNESMQYLTSYTASTRLTRAHSELASIISELEPLERRLQQIATLAAAV